MPATPYPRLSGFLSCVLIAEPAGEIRTKFIHIATASYSWFSEFICTLGSAWRLFCLPFLSFLSFSPKLGHFLQVPSSNCLPLTSSRWLCFLSPWEIKVFRGDISCLPPLTSKPSWLPSLLLALRKDCCYRFSLRLTSYTESFFVSMVRTQGLFWIHLWSPLLHFSSSQGYGFSSSHVWVWELDYKESWALKNWCFWTVVLEKTLESPLDCKEIQPGHPKGAQSWVFIGRTDAEAETPILWPPDAKSWLIWKDPDTGKDWRQEEKGTIEDEMAGWHHWLDGYEFGWTPGVGDGQGGLACCGSWDCKELDTTEWLNWTELNLCCRTWLKS